MQDLPVYPVREQGLHLNLGRDRDLLVAASEKRPDRFRQAMSTLHLQCVVETLRLTGTPVSMAEVVRVADGDTAGSAHPELIRGQLSALEVIERSARREPSLELSLIREVHRLSCPPQGGDFRQGPGRTQFSGAEPSRADLIMDRVANLTQWLAAESASNMTVPERAALAFVRLLEIAPFEIGNFRTAHLLLSFFAEAENYPPLFLSSEEASVVRRDIERALRFDTNDLVSRLARSQARSLAFCLEAVQDPLNGWR